jgi:hypothetical protein
MELSESMADIDPDVRTTATYSPPGLTVSFWTPEKYLNHTNMRARQTHRPAAMPGSDSVSAHYINSNIALSSGRYRWSGPPTQEPDQSFDVLSSGSEEELLSNELQPA